MFELIPVEKLKQMIGQDNGTSDKAEPVRE
jgi:hypothetical protein